MSDTAGARTSGSADTYRAGRILALTAVTIGVLGLAAAAFVLSYRGVHATALAAGVPASLARLYPLIVDAMLVVTGAAVLALRGAGLISRCYVWLVLILLLGGAAAADTVHATGTHLPHRAAAATAAILPWALVLLGFGLLVAMLRYARLRRAGGSKRQQRRAARAQAARRQIPHGEARAHWRGSVVRPRPALEAGPRPELTVAASRPAAEIVGAAEPTTVAEPTMAAGPAAEPLDTTAEPAAESTVSPDEPIADPAVSAGEPAGEPADATDESADADPADAGELADADDLVYAEPADAAAETSPWDTSGPGQIYVATQDPVCYGPVDEDDAESITGAEADQDDPTSDEAQIPGYPAVSWAPSAPGDWDPGHGDLGAAGPDDGLEPAAAPEAPASPRLEPAPVYPARDHEDLTQPPPEPALPRFDRMWSSPTPPDPSE